MGLSHSPTIVTDGLVFCVDAANSRSYPKSGTTWSDLVGGNDGTLTNGPTFSGDNGGGLVFDGTDDYVYLNPVIQNVSQLSISFWVMRFNSSNRNYLGKWSGFSTPNGSKQFLFRNDSIEWFLRNATDNAEGSSGAGVSLSENIWYFICATADGSEIKLSVNGTFGTASSFSGPYIPSTTSSIVVGDGHGSPLDGKMGMIQIYNRALTADEIRQNYNATKGRYK